MNRPNDTHVHKRRALQFAEALLKRELREHVVATGTPAQDAQPS